MIKNLDKIECRLLLSQNYIGHLSYIFSHKPYVVPMTYYYDVNTNSVIGYASKGHKIKALRIQRDVAMVVSEVDSVNHWKSVLVQGVYHECEGSTALMNLRKFTSGVKEIIRNIEGINVSYISEFSSKIVKEGSPIVYKIEVEDIIGRVRGL